jgi:hypothetical protein
MWKREMQYILRKKIYENPNYETKTDWNTQSVFNLRFQPTYLSIKFSH